MALVVDTDGDRSTECNNKFMEFFVCVLPANFGRRHIKHNKKPLYLEWQRLAYLRKNKVATFIGNQRNINDFDVTKWHIMTLYVVLITKR